jgi:hypothetical protein
MNENKKHQEMPRGLIFEQDGTISPEQLAGLDPEVAARLTSPDFIAQAKREIARQESLKRAGEQIRNAAQRAHELRRPSGVSGRQRRKLRKLASRVARAAQKQAYQ